MDRVGEVLNNIYFAERSGESRENSITQATLAILSLMKEMVPKAKTYGEYGGEGFNQCRSEILRRME